MPESRRREIAADRARARRADRRGRRLRPAARPGAAAAHVLRSRDRLLPDGHREDPRARPAHRLPAGASRRVGRLAGGVRATTWMAAPLMAEIAARWIADGTADEARRRKRAEARRGRRVAREVLGPVPRAEPARAVPPLAAPARALAQRHLRRARAPAGSRWSDASQTFLVGPGAAPSAVRVCLGPPRDREHLRKRPARAGRGHRGAARSGGDDRLASGAGPTASPARRRARPPRARCSRSAGAGTGRPAWPGCRWGRR